MIRKPIISLTMGDPAGIGPEICLRALHEQAVLENCVPVLFGDAGVLGRVRSKLKGAPKMPPSISYEEFENISTVTGPLVVECTAVDAQKIKPGKVSGTAGRAAFVYIERAIAAALAGKIDGMVTAPIHKESLNLAGIKFPGHTEIFTSLTAAKRSCMMLYSDQLTVSMATTHIGYHEVPHELSVERILDVIELTAHAMRRMLGRKPHLGVCGLNPHAGEHGLFGHHEEEKLVAPAVAQSRRNGIDAHGPLVPDAAFTPAVRKKFDAIVTLYHDQGHIPFKMLAFETGVNVTLGLPIVRTSVDHGTAFDIAWQGKADPSSLYSAIRLATRLATKEKPEFPARINRHNGRLNGKFKSFEKV
jgi:4-hydroxythreonine-4-phosphate dehydrogenase